MSLKLCDIILKSVQLKVKEISKERDSLRNKIKAKVSATEFRNIQTYVSRKTENLSREIRYRNEKKYKCDNISAIESNLQKRRFRRGKRKKHNKQRKKRWAEQQQILINETKQNCPDQNAIDLCNLAISDSTNSLLSKGPSYVPSPKDINLHKLKQDFDTFVNKLRKHYQNQFITTEDKNEEHLEQSVDRFESPPPKTKEKIYNFRAKPVNNHSLENFIGMLETDIFRPDSYQRIRNNLSTEERRSLNCVLQMIIQPQFKIKV